MEITPLRNNDSLYRIVETINQLVDSKNPELSISNTLVSAANSEKVKYTATDDTFITGEVFTITIPGMYQIYTNGVGRSKYAIKHIKDNSYIQSEEKADAYISDEYLLSAGDQVFFWAVGASHQELTITLKLTASFYDIIERLLGSESEPDNPNYSRVTSVAGKTGEVELDKADVGLEKVDNIRQYSESNPPPYPITSVNGIMGAVTLTKSDMGLSNLDNIRQYSASNPPPYPVNSVAGKTGRIILTKSDVGLTNLDNIRQYSSSNPPPYPVTSVNGKTGSVTGLATVTNLVNGSVNGSIRTIAAKAESSSYTMGIDAFAEGKYTTASGANSHAEGYSSSASKTSAHAEGSGTKASGECSHSEGSSTIASGDYCHAEGFSTKATGRASHAEGFSTTASGNYCHTEGYATIASGNHSHAEGYGSLCDSQYSGHAEGLATIAATTKCVLPIKSYSGTTLTVSQDENFNYLSSALAKITTGMQVLVWNTYYANVRPSIYTISNVNTTNYTITLNTALPSTNYQVAFIVIPEIAESSCFYPSHTEGNHTVAIGFNSHAEGYHTIASGSHSHAEGSSVKASGYDAHSEGGSTTASGYYSHAEGNTTIASGNNSHAEGCYSIASGDYSHAEGYRTTALEDFSHSGGCSTIAKALQYAIGYNNVEIEGGTTEGSSGSCLVIGNGTSSARSNCFRVQFNGQVFSKGAYSTSGADYAELFEWEDGNPNNEDRRGQFVALSGRKIHIAKPGEIPIGVISSTAAIIGNNHSETWQGMYLKDIWGDVLTEYKEIPAETETIQHPAEVALDQDGNEVIVREAWEETEIIKPEFKGMIPVLNPDYNPDDTYIPRHERKEWGIVGLYGQLIVIDDGSCQVNGYCTCAENGTAMASENGYLVIERLDDTHIRILSNFLNTQQQVDTLKEESLSTMDAVTQVYEQGVESGDTAVTSMEAITQNYELILELQATVQKLQKEIQMLKGA